MPNAVPVTTPNASTDAIAGLLLLHTPPGEISENVAVVPMQILLKPVIGAGTELTVKKTVLEQPVASV